MTSQKNRSLFSAFFYAALVNATVAGLLLSSAASAQTAPTPVLSFDTDAFGVEDNAQDTGTAGYSLGFEFTANSASVVTALGYFNDPSFTPNAPFNTVALSPEPSGTYTYAGSHQVGLFQVIPGLAGASETGLLLASVTVTSSSTPNGDFLYTDIAPIALIPGIQYVLAGVTGGTDPYIYDVQNSDGSTALMVAPSITYNEDRYVVSSTLAFAGSTDAGSEPGFFGPNLLVSSVVPVPEASTTLSLGLLLSLGVAGLGMTARRRLSR